MSDPDATPRYCGYTDYREGSAPDAHPKSGGKMTGAERCVWDALAEVEDPEMPISVVDLGLIYGVAVDDGRAAVRMTLTYTGCPARSMLLDDVEAAAASAEGVESADVELVWSPEWSLDMVTDAGKEALREFGVSI